MIFPFIVLLLFFGPTLYGNNGTDVKKSELSNSLLIALRTFAANNKTSFKRTAKTIGALCLLKGFYNVMWNQVTIFNPRTPQSFYDVAHTICFPQFRHIKENENNYHEIAPPPYFAGCTIAAHMVGIPLYATLGKYANKYLLLNDHMVKIMLHSIRILSSLILLKGHYLLASDQINIINPYYKGNGKNEIVLIENEENNDPISIKESKSYVAIPREILFPHIERNNNEKTYERIASPAYISTLGISAYLLIAGCYGIYQELRAWVEESQKKNLFNTNDRELSEINNHLPKPDDDDNFNRPRYIKNKDISFT